MLTTSKARAVGVASSDVVVKVSIIIIIHATFNATTIKWRLNNNNQNSEQNFTLLSHSQTHKYTLTLQRAQIWNLWFLIKLVFK